MTDSRRAVITAHLQKVLVKTPVGSVMPTISEICDLFDVSSPQTVRRAYEPLISAGLVGIVTSPRRRWVVLAHPKGHATLEDAYTELVHARAAINRAISIMDQRRLDLA